MMLKKIITSFALISLAGCSLNSSDLSISCDGKLNDSSSLNGKFNSWEEKTTKVFHFKDKSIHNITCSKWTKEEIHCAKTTESAEDTEKYSLNLDRISGTIIVSNNYFYKKDKSTLSILFKGQCTKLEGAKI
jgi:hypothetical protein